tara:strand:- start:1003 stop:1431 length:429 start_codon:yes stop_codon:yes gene_type:complete
MDFFFNSTINLLITKFLLASLFGSMLFFTIIVAPTVFKVLDEKNARGFLRLVFPRLYLWGIILTTLISIFLAQNSLINLIISLTVIVGFIFSREVLTKKINDASDKIRIDKSFEKKFKFLHSLSVAIFSSQLLLLLILFFNI